MFAKPITAFDTFGEFKGPFDISSPHHKSLALHNECLGLWEIP